MAEKIYTQADMDAVRKRYQENTLDAIRITVADMRTRYDPTFKSEFAFLGRPRTAHERFIDELGVKLFQADAIIRAAAEDQARAMAQATTATNVVPLATARQIIEAGRK